jgi:hypothetical protein
MQIAAHPLEATLGGDPSTANKVRAYVDLKFCKNGAWTDKRLEVSFFFALFFGKFQLIGFHNLALTNDGLNSKDH